MKNCEQILQNFEPIQFRKIRAIEKLTQLKKECKVLRTSSSLSEYGKSLNKLVILCAGSLGRGDIGDLSDLDLFVITKDPKPSNLFELLVIGKIVEVNENLGYPPFSNDGAYLKLHTVKNLCAGTGSRWDDHQNLFTVRLLMILEGQAVFNEKVYDKSLEEIIGNYFRDESEHQPFKPIFLLNDIKRYWCTMCLNYEEIRTGHKPWRKKNINLKFSRMLTIFGTILPLIAKPLDSKVKMLELCKLNPLERLALGLDALKDSKIEKRFPGFLQDYESFLQWKDVPEKEMEHQLRNTSLKQDAEAAAERFSEFFKDALMHKTIPEEFRKRLVI